MDKFSGQKRAAAHLFPPVDPYDQRSLDVGDGHHLYVEQCGNPDGAPVVVLHGGPGGGCSPAMRRYFDPSNGGSSCLINAAVVARARMPRSRPIPRGILPPISKKFAKPSALKNGRSLVAVGAQRLR
jgi:hypothetical protein